MVAPPKHQPLVCQVPGCGVQLEVTQHKGYYRRHKICPDHAQATKMVQAGRLVRWCQLCGKFEALSDFDSERKSCRASLNAHNARRLRRRLCLQGKSLSQPSTTTSGPSAASGGGVRDITSGDSGLRAEQHSMLPTCSTGSAPGLAARRGARAVAAAHGAGAPACSGQASFARLNTPFQHFQSAFDTGFGQLQPGERVAAPAGGLAASGRQSPLLGDLMLEDDLQELDGWAPGHMSGPLAAADGAQAQAAAAQQTAAGLARAAPIRQLSGAASIASSWVPPMEPDSQQGTMGRAASFPAPGRHAMVPQAALQTQEAQRTASTPLDWQHERSLAATWNPSRPQQLPGTPPAPSPIPGLPALLPAHTRAAQQQQQQQQQQHLQVQPQPAAAQPGGLGRASPMPGVAGLAPAQWVEVAEVPLLLPEPSLSWIQDLPSLHLDPVQPQQAQQGLAPPQQQQQLGLAAGPCPSAAPAGHGAGVTSPPLPPSAGPSMLAPGQPRAAPPVWVPQAAAPGPQGAGPQPLSQCTPGPSPTALPVANPDAPLVTGVPGVDPASSKAFMAHLEEVSLKVFRVPPDQLPQGLLWKFMGLVAATPSI